MKIDKRKSVNKLSNELPYFVIEKEGKLYNRFTGKQIVMTKMPASKFFGIDNDKEKE